MKQAILFANGSMEKPPDLSSFIQSSALVIAVDGGIQKCISLDIQPNVLIGDFDSIGYDEMKAFQATGVEIIKYPTHKDETDLELALNYINNTEVSDVMIIGGLGARWDMTIANILLITNPVYTEMKIHFLDGTQDMFLLRAGENTMIKGNLGDTLSLIPLVGDVTGVSTQGLLYPLQNETLQFGTARGVSNVFTLERVQINIKHGLLLCIINSVVN